MILEAGNKNTSSYLDILYKITLRCNLNCDYCIQHDNTVKETDTEIKSVANFINSLSEVRTETHVTVLGGEPTCSNLELFLYKLHNRVSVEIHTNLTKTLDYYENLKKIHNNITFTSTWHNKSLLLYSYNDFILKCNSIGKMKIFIMFDPSNSDICFKIFDELYNKHDVEIHKIYTPGDKYKIDDIDFIKIKELNKKNLGKELIRYKFDNGNIKYFDNEIIKNLRFNYFENYKCDAGSSCLAINYDGKVYPCFTYLINKEYEIDKNNFMFNNTVCKYKRCLCELDIYKCLN